MYHLGNPSLKDDSEGRCFFAYKLLSEESKKVDADFLEFAPGRIYTNGNALNNVYYPTK